MFYQFPLLLEVVFQQENWQRMGDFFFISFPSWSKCCLKQNNQSYITYFGHYVVRSSCQDYHCSCFFIHHQKQGEKWKHQSLNTALTVAISLKRTWRGLCYIYAEFPLLLCAFQQYLPGFPLKGMFSSLSHSYFIQNRAVDISHFAFLRPFQ